MRTKGIFITLIILVVFNFSAYPQKVEEYLSRYTAANGKGYMQPLADVFGASFNTGLFHSAKIKKKGFQLYFGLVGSDAFIGSDQKTFKATTDGFFTPVQTVQAPTILGSTQTVNVSGNGGTVYVLPGGLNVKYLPLVVPQLTVGSLYGTDLTARFFAYSGNKDFGQLKLFAIGLRHSISQYFPSTPLDLAVGCYKQQFTMGNLFTSNTLQAGAQASKRIKIFTFYGGLGYENSKMDITYTEQSDNSKIAFNLTGRNTVRFTAGVTFNLGAFKLNVDYNLGQQSVLCAGLGVGFGE